MAQRSAVASSHSGEDGLLMPVPLVDWIITTADTRFHRGRICCEMMAFVSRLVTVWLNCPNCCKPSIESQHSRFQQLHSAAAATDVTISWDT